MRPTITDIGVYESIPTNYIVSELTKLTNRLEVINAIKTLIVPECFNNSDNAIYTACLEFDHSFENIVFKGTTWWNGYNATSIDRKDLVWISKYKPKNVECYKAENFLGSSHVGSFESFIIHDTIGGYEDPRWSGNTIKTFVMEHRSEVSTGAYANAAYYWSQCSSLETIIIGDCDKCSNAYLSGSLTSTSVKNFMLAGIKNKVPNIANAPNITHESLVYVMEHAYDWSGDSNTHTWTIGSTNLAKLTQAEIDAFEAKGWTLA